MSPSSSQQTTRGGCRIAECSVLLRSRSRKLPPAAGEENNARRPVVGLTMSSTYDGAAGLSCVAGLSYDVDNPGLDESIATRTSRRDAAERVVCIRSLLVIAGCRAATGESTE